MKMIKCIIKRSVQISQHKIQHKNTHTQQSQRNDVKFTNRIIQFLSYSLCIFYSLLYYGHSLGVKEYLNFLNSPRKIIPSWTYKIQIHARPESFKGIFNFKELEVKVLSNVVYRSFRQILYSNSQLNFNEFK